MRLFRDVLLVTTGLAIGMGALNAAVEALCTLHWTALAHPAAVLVLVALLALWWTLATIEEA